MVSLLVLFLITGFLSVFGQMIIPDLSFFNSKPELSALLVIYFTLKVPFFYAFSFALYVGILSDVIMPGIFGTTSLGLTSLFLFVSFLKPYLDKIGNRWMIFLCAAVGIFFYSLIDYLLYELESHQWHWSMEFWTKLVAIPFLSTLLAVPLYFILDLFFFLLHIPTTKEELFPSFSQKDNNLS
ncbi:hypothetical protein [Methylacidiphilum caldifontis]|uniref:Rod shape-determining protein MreD n=1 Tax=Methylacidiphilum caldifontis TaxID=2795386 RepID=A0A4Y8PGT8_9BACT|nr:hypothetical protein [Methylacidiphilum caldifontis]QSR88468.1 hypothetical protein IT6_08855 [Methylacidiphilum caldifontis]TFE71297.1 hypothetical protein A7Q10_04795 [Methylacidiphilum caldifontis]